MQLISASLFHLFASKYPEYWKVIEGSEIVHRVWGKCTIQRVCPQQELIIVNFRKVDLSFFRDDVFSELFLAQEIAEKVTFFETQKTKIILCSPKEETRSDHDKHKLLPGILEIAKTHSDFGIEQAQKPLQDYNLTSVKPIEAEKQSQRLVAQERSRLIENFCITKKIIHLIHFTRIENLKRIVQQGLINRKELTQLQEIERPIFNDTVRLDGHTEAVCLSISYPNYQMFYKLRMNNPDEWVVILLSSSILWELDCAFCCDNAASSLVRKFPLCQRRTYEAFIQMFSDMENVSRNDLNLPINFTTNPQAEVLVFDTINPKYMRCVHFRTLSKMKAWRTIHSNPNNIPLIASDVFFNPRCDWQKWKKMEEKLILVKDTGNSSIMGE